MRNISLVSVLVAASAFTAQAFAQEGSEAAVEGVLACQTIEDPATRLACLDKAVNTLAVTRIIQEEEDVAEATATPSTGSPSQELAATEEPKQEFGRDSLPYSKREELKERPKKLTARIVELRLNRYGKFTAVLENGQVWRQLNSDNRLPFGGKSRLYTAKIKRGLMGNYMMTIDELDRTARVKRIK